MEHIAKALNITKYRLLLNRLERTMRSLKKVRSLTALYGEQERRYTNSLKEIYEEIGNLYSSPLLKPTKKKTLEQVTEK